MDPKVWIAIVLSLIVDNLESCPVIRVNITSNLNSRKCSSDKWLQKWSRCHQTWRAINSQSGKCHGGINDKSSLFPAVGGINKERYNPEYSPHFKLHPLAAEYAVRATVYFISSNVTGLFSAISFAAFQKIFALYSRQIYTKSSLTFCIDTTGSMSDEISAVISNSVDLVTLAQGSHNEPANYVLATFNYPASQTSKYVTNDGYEMITQLRTLKANGGDDCPEYAMSGLIAAFLPQRIAKEDKTRSHDDITREGIYQAIADIIHQRYKSYLPRDDPATEIKRFFGSDSRGFRRFGQTLEDIIDGCNEIQQKAGNVAFYSVNGEQIEKAHRYLQRTYKEIQSQSVNIEQLDAVYVRQKIGEYLYTLQDFYSNTNWVEMQNIQSQNNISIYKYFGIPGHDLVQTASPDVDTCYNCDPGDMSGDSCEHNLESNVLLTSGYRSGQDVIKPARAINSQSGKCSHGGINDKSSLFPAVGGINKERYNPEYSPHFKLHPLAAEYAVRATVYFISSNVTGLFSAISFAAFQKIFALYSRQIYTKSSLTFCIDTTGSMSDEISAVISNSVDLVTLAQGSHNEPANYVLATFNDPASKTSKYVTTDGYEMITQLRTLKANGGDDCPEYAMSGLIAALKASLPNSHIYFFSDADAKDESRKNEVIQLAANKSIKITFLLTGNCSGGSRRRRHADGDLVRRAVPRSVFDVIANKTGGTVYHTQKVNIEKVMEQVMETQLPSAEVMVETLYLNESQFRTNFTIDALVSVIRLEITKVNSQNLVTLIKPDGSTASTGVKFLSQNNLGIFALTNPDTGVWSIVKSSSVKDAWKINITAQSPLDFTTKIMDKSSDGISFPLFGNPLSDKTYDVAVSVFGLSNATINQLALLNSVGYPILQTDLIAVNNTSSEISSKFKATVMFKQRVSAIQIYGKDSYGDHITRTNNIIILPVTAVLHVPLLTDAVPLNIPMNVSFTVQNMGENNQTFEADISVVSGDKLGPTRKKLALGSMESHIGYFTIKPTVPNTLLVYDISLKLANDTTVIQSKKRRIPVTQKHHPKCEVETSTECPDESLNTANCSEYKWTASSLVTYSGVIITQFILTVNISVNETKSSISTTEYYISGTCCTPNVQLTVYDNDGYSGTCAFDVSGGKPVRAVIDESKLTTTEHTTVKLETRATNNKLAIILGAVVGSIAAVVLIAILIHCKSRHHRKNGHVSGSNGPNPSSNPDYENIKRYHH